MGECICIQNFNSKELSIFYNNLFKIGNKYEFVHEVRKSSRGRNLYYVQNVGFQPESFYKYFSISEVVGKKIKKLLHE